MQSLHHCPFCYMTKYLQHDCQEMNVYVAATCSILFAEEVPYEH
jgi:coproporphyrinogen III oxidase-like Fe-S oxidoreductase